MNHMQKIFAFLCWHIYEISSFREKREAMKDLSEEEEDDDEDDDDGSEEEDAKIGKR